MEVKLVHPSDPEKKVVLATDDVQVNAYKNHGFVEEDAWKEQQEAAKGSEAEGADTSDLQAKLEQTQQELAEVKKELKAERARNTRSANKAQEDSQTHAEQKTDESVNKETK